MSSSLAVYLHDHLAGSHFGVELVEGLQKQHPDEGLGTFAGKLLDEIKEDQQTLLAIIQRVGEAHFDAKDVTAWLAEKTTRLKLGRDQNDGLGTLEALEALGLGITGKLSLWQTLAVVAEADTRLKAWNYGELSDRAKEQIARVTRHRLDLARKAL